MRGNRIARLAVLASLALLAGGTVSAARKAFSSAVVPPDTQVYGKTYAEWSADWWTWILSSPAVDDQNGNNTNPNLDQTGQYALTGQKMNQVVFLPGSFGQAITRTVTVPAGHPLFFPVMNAFADNLGEPKVYTVDYNRKRGTDLLYSVAPDTLFVTLDGVSQVATENWPDFWAVAPPYTYHYGPDSLAKYWGSPDLVNVTVHDATSVGWWVMLSPLAPGGHTLTFGGQADGWGVDITYHLTVAPAR